MTKTNRPATRALLTLTLLAAGSALTACGSSAGNATPISASSASADSAQALNPCTVLDDQAIESVLGADVTRKGPASDAFRGRRCAWTVADPGTIAGDADLVISTYRGSAFYRAGTMGDPVAGIGDEAQGGPDRGVILFRKGEDVVEVHIVAMGQSDLPGKVVPLATAAAAAIKG